MVAAPPPSQAHIDWATLLIGFALGFIGSAGGAFVQAFANSAYGRRDHQFERMIRATDEIRHDIEHAGKLSHDYWNTDGTRPEECVRLESEIMHLQSKIMGELALVRKIDAKRFQKLEAICEDDFYDVLTGGQFQVRGRSTDPAMADRTRRYGRRLSDKIAQCSTTPTARRWFAGN